MRGQVVFHVVVEPGSLVGLEFQAVLQVVQHLAAAGDVLRPLVLEDELRDGGHGLVGGLLVQFVAVGAAVEAVEPQELGLFGEGTRGIDVDELFKVSFRRHVIAVLVVAQAPVELHRIVLRQAAGQHGQRFEHLRGAGIFLGFEEFERLGVLGRDVVPFQQGGILRLAGGQRQKGCQGYE